jgi:exonuclease VII large subunit
MRGYSITTIDNQLISSISQVELDDEVQIRVSDGQMICKVLDKGELS